MVMTLVLLPAFLDRAATMAPCRIMRKVAPSGFRSAWRSARSQCLSLSCWYLAPALFPWLLKKVESIGSRELFTLAIVAIAVGVAYGSSQLFGCSFALGAFFAGVVIHQSDHHHRAASTLEPFQDAFGTLFFIAIGMLFDPYDSGAPPFEVLAVVAIIMVGKSLAAFGIVLALRRPLSTALMVSAALAQIGEFSFILAALGASFGLISDEAQNLIIAGALLSIALNPFLFVAASRLCPAKAPAR